MKRVNPLARCRAQDFGPDVIGVWLPTLDELVAALAGGGDARLLAEIHVALLRVVQVPLAALIALFALRSGAAPVSYRLCGR